MFLNQLLKFTRPTIYFFLRETELTDLLREKMCQEETAQLCFVSFRNEMVFTQKRILILERRGLSGKKIRYATIPFKSITWYRIGMVGGWDPDAEILLNLRGNVKIQLRFLRNKDLNKESIHKAYEIITRTFICDSCS
ncbi:MAG: PH domain-containing protein [Clostridia bacterium]|nr:PH domain-containing protein [Clostridia bacterium]